MKSLSQRGICTPVFIAKLPAIAKTWKQPKCPSMNECIKKMWYIYKMAYYSGFKKKEILPIAKEDSHRRTNTA